MAALAFETRQGKLAVTCSFGVGQWEAGESIDGLLKRADSALYEAKSRGRNQVARAPPAAESADAPGRSVVRSSSRAASAAPKPADWPYGGKVLTWWSSDTEACVSARPGESGAGQPSSKAYVLDDKAQEQLGGRSRRPSRL